MEQPTDDLQPDPEPLQLDAPIPPEIDSDTPAADEGPVHRPLIRATLPRPEGLKTERPVPEFTIRQNARPHGNFRGADARGKPRNNGHQRFARGGAQGRPGGFGRGPSGGNAPRHGNGPRKRSR